MHLRTAGRGGGDSNWSSLRCTRGLLRGSMIGYGTTFNTKSSGMYHVPKMASGGLVDLADSA